jgi:glycosyltransferase involved in cell wall biosynthesis
MGEYARWLAVGDPKASQRLRFRNAWEGVRRRIARRISLIDHVRVRARFAGEDASLPRPVESWLNKRNKVRKAGLEIRRNGTPRVLHYIGGLIPGGAERQLCNFVAGAVRRGWNMRVLISNQMVGDYTHYADLLHRVHVFPDSAGAHFDPRFLEAVHPIESTLEVLAKLPPFFLPWTVDLFGELLADPPDILHAWLDHTNVWGGAAGLLSDVPIIILSTRNVNPDHFPYLAQPAFKPWYQFLAASPGVHFINNSHPGARDYAEWLGLPVERFHVVRNGVDFSTVERAGAAEIQALRRELRLPTDARLVVGVFRLSQEKEPLTFAEVVARIMRRCGNLHAAVVGVGPYENQLREAIEKMRLTDRFQLLGRRKDVPVILSAADVVLLTSSKEGTPNVLLEAQWLGRPVVATKAGGASEAVAHDQTGLLVDVGDVDGLTAALGALLDDDERRRRLGEAGPRFIETHFALDRMVDETLGVYEVALEEAADRCAYPR